MSKFNPKSFNPDWINVRIDKPCMDYILKMGMYLCDREEASDPCENLQSTKEGNRPGWNAVTISQLRNIYEAIKIIQFRLDSRKVSDIMTSILLLQPKIAYQAARVLNKNSRSNIVGFCYFTKKAIDCILDTKEEDRQTFKLKYGRFCQMMEGIIAYHKVYGGKE